MLENRLDKAELKCNEATTIQRTYNQIKDHLLKVTICMMTSMMIKELKLLFFKLKESLTYNNRLDDLEKQIQSAKEESRELKIMFKDAIVARENAANEFSKYEDKVYRYER